MSTAQGPSRIWIVWPGWVLLSGLGWAGLSMFVNMLPQGSWASLDGVLPFVSFSVMAAIVAAIQWILLRRHFTGGLKWVGAGAAGMWLASVIAFPLKLQDIRLSGTGIYLDELAFGLLFGLVLGTVQWLVLRSWLPRAWWWIFANGLGWGLGALIAQLVPLNWSYPYTGTIDAFIQLGTPTVLSGFTLMMLLRKRAPG